MGGGGKGGSADPSGMYMAMASAQAAERAYALGEEQLQWTKQVWNQEQPLMNASEQQQMALATQQQKSLAQMQAESAQQWQQYQQLYQPLEGTYVGQAENWASPENIALQRGQAMSAVGEAGQHQLNAAAAQLQAYGVNPSSPRYASMYVSAQPMLGAAQAAAGTTAEQNLKLQQMGLESGAINTGRGLVNATQGLTGAGTSAGQAATGAASGAAGTAQSNLATGSQAMTAPTNWFNAGANNMNSYVNAVNGYNQSQAQFAQAGASEMGGLGSALGSVLGLGFMKFAAKGGPVGYDDGGAIGDDRPGPTITYPSGQSAPVMMNRQAPIHTMTSQDLQSAAGPPPTPPLPQINRRAGGRAIINDPRAAPFADPRTFQRQNYDDGGDVGMVDPQLTPQQGGGATGIPSAPVPPGGTPGGAIPPHASPSMGAASDDVPAMLTANEFVIPKDVATWKGHEFFVKAIDQARRQQQQFQQRDDIGGEPTGAIPQQPTFVSRPQAGPGAATAMMAPMGAIPGRPMPGMG